MISIVIPTFNSEKYMPALLDSVFKTGIDDMEVIIVDDRSTDNTVEVVKKYPVILIELEKNSGPATARNVGVMAAKGDIIFFLDSDVIVLDGTIKEVKDHFDKNPSANCVIGICSTKPLNNGFVPHYMAMFEYIHLIGTKDDLVSVFAPRCGAVRKDFFEKTGGYSEMYKGADVEDFEFARRVYKTDRITLNRKMMVIHKFATFRQAVRNYFRRTVMWVHLFFREKRLDNAGPTAPGNGIAAICAFLSFLSLFFVPVFSQAAYIFPALLIIFLTANMKWWIFMRREAGIMFAVRALFLNYMLGIDIMIAAIYGVMSYPFKKGFEGPRGQGVK